MASGNFSLTAAMCQAAALLAARHLPQWEVIDYASATKPDVPSGTARELAERLGEVRAPELGHPIDELHGPQEARGANVAGTQVHSVASRASSSPPKWSSASRRAPDHPPRRGRHAGALRRRHADRGRAGHPGLVGLTRGLDALLLS